MNSTRVVRAQPRHGARRSSVTGWIQFRNLSFSLSTDEGTDWATTWARTQPCLPGLRAIQKTLHCRTIACSSRMHLPSTSSEATASGPFFWWSFHPVILAERIHLRAGLERAHTCCMLQVGGDERCEDSPGWTKRFAFRPETILICWSCWWQSMAREVALLADGGGGEGKEE